MSQSLVLDEPQLLNLDATISGKNCESRSQIVEVNGIVIFSILTAMAIGIAIGTGVIIAILVTRINPTFNSLTHVQDYAGRIAEVVAVITPEQAGSILIRRESATLKLRATTHENRTFRVGDRVVIVEVHKSQAWVTSAELDD